MKNISITIIVLLLAGLTSFYLIKGAEGVKEEVIPETTQEPQYQITHYTVEDGDVFASVMEKLGFDYAEAMKILESASTTYDFTKIKIGRPFNVFKNDNGNILKFEYEENNESLVRVEFINEDIQVSLAQIKYQIETQKVSGVINSSLWLDGQAAGMPDDLIIKFADVFDWTVDFGFGVQKGDTFEVLYEKRYRNGEYVGTGKVLAGKFVNSGSEYFGYLFSDDNGDLAYYNEKGESMRKQFLRAPLEYRYISSGFTGARVDPLNGHITGHHAIDYAAQFGTPVRAVGDGIVETAGWNSSGLGNFISIHHSDTYTTQYGHLSSFAKGIKKGSKVTQGQIIAYVGSTGHSTGPHLHYQIKERGALVNPLTIKFPPGESISTEKQSDFDQARLKFYEMMSK